MASTTFIDNQTTIYAAWLNDVNNAVYNGVFVSPTITATSMVCTGTASGAGFTNLINNVFASPGAIGSATPNTGAFTTLSATTLTATTLTATTLNATAVTTPLPLKGTTSGTVSLTVPAVAGTNTITFPSGSGTISVNGLSSNIVSGTAVSASGTSVDFTGIPSWAKRVTVIFNSVSTNGTSEYLVQIGTSGGVQNTGYISYSSRLSNASTSTSSTAGYVINMASAGDSLFGGTVVLNLISGNVWIASGCMAYLSGTITTGGTKDLGATLDRVRITTVNGSQTFDAGSINIMWE